MKTSSEVHSKAHRIFLSACLKSIGSLFLLAFTLGAPQARAADPADSTVYLLSPPRWNGAVNICSGVLISDNLVLTASHCLDQGIQIVTNFKISNPSEIPSIPQGRVSKPVPGKIWSYQTYRLDKPEDQWNYFSHDLGLVEIDQSLEQATVADLLLFDRSKRSMKRTELFNAVSVGYDKSADLTRVNLVVTMGNTWPCYYSDDPGAYGQIKRGNSGGGLHASYRGVTGVVGVVSGISTYQGNSFFFPQIDLRFVAWMERVTGRTIPYHLMPL